MSLCAICGEKVPKGDGQVCMKCRARFGPETGLSKDEETSRLLAALLQVERRQHEETRRKLAKAEHDRDRYHRRLLAMMDGIQSIISKMTRLQCPSCDEKR